MYYNVIGLFIGLFVVSVETQAKSEYDTSESDEMPNPKRYKFSLDVKGENTILNNNYFVV